MRKNPYKDIKFQREEVSLTNSKGEVIWSRDVSFPHYFSSTARSIVAEKYMTPDEQSFADLIDRVSFTIADAGKSLGYFKDDDAYESFLYKLRRYQVLQKFAFNSPIYFNCGLYDNWAGSACFILSMEDNMDSILETGRDEARIFKNGSGSGINYSCLRSAMEPVRTTGRASGAVSFLRGHDAFAGVIRSGGVVRRSAKMAVLDVSHGDIFDFIRIKSHEEAKKRLLASADFKPFYSDGSLADEVFFQNTNLSVAMDQKFLDAVEDDVDWDLIAVTDGSVLKTVSAQSLMKEIATAAWASAEPGVHFKDNINNMHTCPSAGPILSSNPCSEFFFINNSACNLASINLCNVNLANDDEFEDLVSTIITAQDIICSAASYPTSAIEENSHKYRPLGLGYTNLGGLLMLKGIPYNSDAGFQFCAQLTNKLSSYAYKASADLASRMGAYEGFVAEDHYKVISKHREYAFMDGLDTSIWDELLENKKPLHNAQVTLLAPTGCLVADSRVLTSKGLVCMDTLGDVEGDQWQDIDETVRQEIQNTTADKFYVNGTAQCTRIYTASGFSLCGTSDHKVRVFEDGYVWKKLSAITHKDRVFLCRGGYSSIVTEYSSVEFIESLEDPRIFSAKPEVLISYFSKQLVFESDNAPALQILLTLVGFHVQRSGRHIRLRGDIGWGVGSRSIIDDKPSLFLDFVNKIEDVGEQDTYDISVPENHTYIADGFISHNTISFMMDAATTGIEPEYSLIRYKNLVGGGQLKITNNVMKKALSHLGYDDSVYESFLEDGQLRVSDEHLPIFHCGSDIPYMGHLKMMQAAQKYLSGSISKCVVGDTIIPTTAGMIPIEKFNTLDEEDTYDELEIGVASTGGVAQTDQFYYGGLREVWKVYLSDGRVLGCTDTHRIKAVYGDKVDWVYAHELNPGDYVPVPLGYNVFSTRDAELHFDQGRLYHNQTKILVPETMNPDLAWFVGAYIADGSYSGNTLVLTSNNSDVLLKCDRIVKEQFGLSGKFDLDNRVHYTTMYKVTSKSLHEFMMHIGCTGTAGDKEIPWSILESSRESVIQFVNGLFLEGCVPATQPKIGIVSKSHKLLTRLQLVLNNFGILCNISESYNKKYDTMYHLLTIYSEEFMGLFAEIFTLDDEHKAKNLRKHLSNGIGVSTSDVIPFAKDDIKESIRDHLSEYRSCYRGKHISRHKAREIWERFGCSALDETFINNWHFIRVLKVERSVDHVYDFHVPSNHTFIGNGLINHNTVSMPRESTVEEVENLYRIAHSMGLKSVIIYREGSKEEQVLVKADNKDTIDIKPADTKTPMDHREPLPMDRLGGTHKFIINGQVKGYINWGVYDDGRLGEIFIRIAKEGSTMSGLLDSLATVTSVSLQYGVPLEDLVSKMINRRFEPAGMTRNEDIRFTHSIIDYIFKYLAYRFLDTEALTRLGLKKIQEDQSIQHEISVDASLCPVCGSQLRRLGSCEQCDSCGFTGGSCS